MVYRVYVEKKPGQDLEAQALLSDINSYLGIPGITRVRILNRYDAEGIDEELFNYSCGTVFSEPPVDNTYSELEPGSDYCFAVEYLPGQFDQRADSAAQCISLISQKESPTIRTAKIYLLYGSISDSELAQIKKHVINPVEAREASIEKPETLALKYDIPTEVPTLTGFISLDREGLMKFIADYGLAMDIDDITFLQDYFKSEHRDPTLTEVRVLDTYWSDHCRHTTFLTSIDDVSVTDPELADTYKEYLRLREELGRTGKPITLMDLATIGCRYLKATGKLPRLDESEEINACTVKIKVNVDGTDEDWLLLFKNETHNHPTEIEPFGGAATCIGGAIRDPLSGRSYVYAAMRVTGAADPLKPLKDTIPGKLPQKKLTYTAAQGYSSYGNQIGLATGIVDEIYHPGYAAKRMEIGAVIAAAPAKNVRREVPAAGDRIILLGGRTGRDGCGGATGSSKSHTSASLTTCGAEVQKGNAPQERKLQRLFRNERASQLIKRCNDFGAGGVSVAIGELSPGLDINLDLVKKKYAGLDGTELAISESQERMAVVVEAKDMDEFLALCAKENLEATPVATVSDSGRLRMTWNNKMIVDISREFLDSNGATKHTTAVLPETVKDFPEPYNKTSYKTVKERLTALVGDLNVCSKQGLSERFDSTIGAGTVLMPFGGKYQRTPIQAMVQKVSVEQKHTDTVSLMSWGYNPFITEISPYHGAYLAVTESICKLIASGADYKDIYLTFQEYFEKPNKDPKCFGRTFAALLGALRCQLDYEAASIGGKDSMSGTFEDLSVPPTLCSFAVTTSTLTKVVSPEFKLPGSKVYLLSPEYDGILPRPESVKEIFATIKELRDQFNILSMYTPTYGGVAEAIFKMCLGNGLGFDFANSITADDIFKYAYGSFIIESETPVKGARLLGETLATPEIKIDGETINLNEENKVYEQKLEPVFPCFLKDEVRTYENVTFKTDKALKHAPAVISARPKVLIPVFPGTNCELDSAKAVLTAGGDPDVFVIKNLTAADITASVEDFANRIDNSQMIFIPGGFSGADEPDGSAKFITAFFRNGKISEAVGRLLDERQGLMCGICNGFQALVKLGLLPYGKIIEQTSDSPTLTFNRIGRHQSKIVRTRIASNLSPWLAGVEVGDIISVPISHGEGKFLCSEEMAKALAAKGQIATQYVDLAGNATSDIRFNPNDSVYAIEGITSEDGRIFGKMGHSERDDFGLYKNVPGVYNNNMFISAVKYFK